MRKGWVLLALMAIAIVPPASAAPNFLGSTGLLITPNADALGLREWNVHVHGTDDLTTFGVNFGIFENLEAGVTGFDPDGGDTEALINLKYRLVPETATTPAIAVGVVDVADELDADQSIYVVLSKGLGMVETGATASRLRGHIGIGDGIYDTVFGGVDLVLSPRLLAMAEYDSEDFNFGVRLGLTPEVRVDLAILDGDFGAGISWNALF